MPDMLTATIVMIFATLVGFACIFLVCTAAIVKTAYITIQPGQIFGGWQHVLNRLNESQGRIANALFKPLGGCEFCFAHMFAVISYALFVLFITYILGSWPLHMTGNFWINAGVNVVGYLMYVCTSTVLSTLAITRL